MFLTNDIQLRDTLRNVIQFMRDYDINNQDVDILADAVIEDAKKNLMLGILELPKPNFKKVALAVIYEVDYDIGKEADPDVFDECPELIEQVATVIEAHLK